MAVVSRGFGGHRDGSDPRVPPGQYRTDDFPVLSAGPTPMIRTNHWQLDVTDTSGESRAWSWADLMGLPVDEIAVDIHCVTKWTRLDTTWRGVSLDAILADFDTDAEYALVRSHGGYTTNLPVEDLLDGKAWIAFEFEGEALEPEHGGPARLLVPHLYLWKSAKWVRGIDLRADDEPGFWEGLGYHNYGDPWLEQRYVGD